LFIDGLDEYDGEPLEIIKLFTTISKLPNVKICLSSRPLYDFVRAFRSFPTLRLQDLTFNDIKQYVGDELGANDQMQELLQSEPVEAPRLVLEIIDKADGVFLWVKLVVLSLLRGLRNSDHIFDLQKRLRLLPPSLEGLFDHILDRLEPVYLQQSSRIFQIFSASLSIEHHLTSVELSFAEEPNARSLILSGNEKKNMSDYELASRSELVEIWLLTRCGGLIESRSHPFIKPNQKLGYLHRTVRDFLELPRIWSRILKQTMGTDFNPYRSLLHSIMLYEKLSPDLLIFRFGEDRHTVHMLRRFAELALKCAYQAELDTGQAEVLILDELDRMITHHLTLAMPTVYPWVTDVTGKNLLAMPTVYSWVTVATGKKLEQDREDFLALAIRLGLCNYVAKKIEEAPDIVTPKRLGRPLLHYAVKASGLIYDLRISSRMIQLLLGHGACPNRVYEGSSAWELFRKIVWVDTRNENRHEYLKIMQIFLQNHADPEQSVPKSALGIKGLIDYHFREDVPVEAKELQQLLESRMRIAMEKKNVRWKSRAFRLFKHHCCRHYSSI
jgi:hypothetical protein